MCTFRTWKSILWKCKYGKKGVPPHQNTHIKPIIIGQISFDGWEIFAFENVIDLWKSKIIFINCRGIRYLKVQNL